MLNNKTWPINGYDFYLKLFEVWISFEVLNFFYDHFSFIY